MNLFRFLLYIRLVGRGVSLYQCAHMETRGQLWKSVLSPHHAGSSDQTQAVWPGSMCLHPFIHESMDSFAIPFMKWLGSQLWKESTHSTHLITAFLLFNPKENNLLTHPPNSSALDSLVLTASKKQSSLSSEDEATHHFIKSLFKQ